VANAPTSRPLDRLTAVLEGAQSDDPFARVTVVVPSPFARVQLRRAIGARRATCNVDFRTWGELTADLARGDSGPTERVPTPRQVNEALRQVLLATPSAFSAFARSPEARTEMVGLFYELWRAGPTLLARLVEHGGRAGSLVATLHAVEAHLGEHGFADPGRLLELAATAPIDRAAVGATVLWYPRTARGRDRAVLQHLEESGVPVTTIATEQRTGSLVSHVIECSDPDEEVRVIARRLIKAAEEGVPLWRQAIIHPPLGRYRRIVHQQLVAAGVASSGPSPMTLAHSATGRALVGLFDLAGAGWGRADVIRWLGTAPITNGPRGQRVPVHRWDDVSARAGVIEGLEQWRSRLQRFAGGGGSRDLHVAHGDTERHSANSLADFVARLAEELDPRCIKWSDWAAWAARLLDLYLHPDDRSENWPTPELVAARAVREVLADLGGLDDVGSSTDLAAFKSTVEAELASHGVRDDSEAAQPASEGDPDTSIVPDRVGLPGPVGSGVFVGSPTEARGLTFDRLYVVGMADQFLPGSDQRGALIPEPQLDDTDWPTSARRVAELFDDLLAVLALTGDGAVASWPRVDPRTGREHDRSRWLDPIGETGSGWDESVVASFRADVCGPTAATVPVSAADRLLGELARSVAAGTPIERHPAVVGANRTTGHPLSPPLDVSVTAALAPLTPGFGRFEGFVGAGQAGGITEELSPTRLEEYAGCPRRYLLGRELKLAPPFRPEATEQMEARDRGSLIHQILATYVGERINDGAPATLDRLIEIAEEAFSTADQEGRCGPPLMATVERATLLREVRRFFEEDTLEPCEVELVFGLMGASEDVATDRLEPSADVGSVGRSVDAVEVSLADGRTLRFRGAIDRIDRGPNGTLVVSDYKTGRQSALDKLIKDPVAGGTKLQLPIYALAAQAVLGWEGPVEARYWLTSWGRAHGSLRCTLDDALLTRLREVLSAITDGIDGGAFPGVPGEETYRYRRPTFENCSHCDFDRLCPTDRDRRWSVARVSPVTAPINALGEPPDDALLGMVRSQPVDLTKRH